MNLHYLRKSQKYDPDSSKPYKLSRSKVELFLDCARCFYLDRRQGLRRPGRVTYHLNNAVDFLLKKEFDHYRESHQPHPIMKQEGVPAVPYAHKDLERWREPLHGGLEFLHEATQLLLHGAPDDLWIDSEGRLIVVDYKATRAVSKESLAAGEHPSYERQLEFYTWLLKNMGFLVADVGYLVVAETQLFQSSFDHKLNFDLHLLNHPLNLDWIEPVLGEIKHCLQSEQAPESSPKCDYCNYLQASQTLKERPIQARLL